MALFDDLCAAVDAARAESETPGAAVGLLHEGEEHVAGFGTTSVENPLAVTPETLFQIGSITKTFTGTVAMILVERGDLDLDEPVRRYLPKLRLADEEVAARVTSHHLLTHTAGWVGDYFADHGSGDDAAERIVADLVHLPQQTPLGEVWSYNNAGFYLAGRVIEVVTGEPYERVVADLLLAPLGLTDTLFFAEDVMTRRFAVGHHRAEDGPPSVARPWAIGRAHHAAGGIASSVRDLLRYARFHLGDGDGILTRASLDEMQRPHAAAAPIFGSVGITWGIDDRSGVRVVYHGGGTNGQVALLALAPDSGTVLAILTNHQDGGEISGAALRIVQKAPRWARSRADRRRDRPVRVPRDLPVAAARRRGGRDGGRVAARSHESRRLPVGGLTSDAKPAACTGGVLRARPDVRAGWPGEGNGSRLLARPGRAHRVVPLRRARHAAAALTGCG